MSRYAQSGAKDQFYCTVCYITLNHRHKKIHRLLIGTACLPCFGWVVMLPATALFKKQNFYCTVYYTTLNSNYEAKRASKNLKQIVENRAISQK